MIVASLVYIRQAGKTLMLHRNKKDGDYHQDKYNGIGGKLEAGESPEECAIREVKEETGLTAKRLVYRGHIAFPVFDGTSDWLCFIYECPEFTGQIKACDEGTLHWIDDQKLFDLNLWQGDPYFLDIIYHSNKRFTGKFIYQDKRLIDYHIQTE